MIPGPCTQREPRPEQRPEPPKERRQAQEPEQGPPQETPVRVPLPFVIVRQVLLKLPQFAVVSEEGCPRRRRLRAHFHNVSLLAIAGTSLFLAVGAHRVAGCPPVVASASVAAHEPLLGLATLAVLVCTLSRSTSLVLTFVAIARLLLIAAVRVSLLLCVRLDLLFARAGGIACGGVPPLGRHSPVLHHR